MPDRTIEPPPPAATTLRAIAEVVLLATVAISPWPFASNFATGEFALALAVLLLCALRFAAALVEGKLRVRFDVPTIALTGLVGLTLLQLLPLPESLVETLSPYAVQLHRDLRPAVGELLPGETGPAPPRETWLPVSLDPYLSRVFLGRVLGLLLLYVVVRNWLVGREQFRRVAWVCAINGGLIAVLGFAQLASSPKHVVFWSVETDGQVFGTFVCKNHFPDYAYIAIGLAIGLILKPKDRSDPDRQKSLPQTDPLFDRALDGVSSLMKSPRLFVLAAFAALAALGILFSLSRGGVIGAVAAAVVVGCVIGRSGNGISAGGWAVLVAVALTVAVAGAYAGLGDVTDRIESTASGQAVESRWPLWKDALNQSRKFPLTGAGNGTFLKVEPLDRTQPLSALFITDNAHNEYVEAWHEGGPVRLALTVWLAWAAVRAAVRGYGRLHGRATGPLCLGAAFGLVGIALHAVLDFGIHMPAVAVIAAIITAHAFAAADDPGYEKVRRRKGETPPAPEPEAKPDPLVAYAGGVLLVLAAVAVAYSVGYRAAGDRHRRAAEAAAKAGRLNDRIAEAVARANATPGDPDAQAMLAEVCYLAGDTDAGLRAARAGRDAGPLYASNHVRLGQHARRFASADAPQVYFTRARQLRPNDPDVWFGTANESAKARDFAAAAAGWKRVIELKPEYGPDVLKAAAAVPGFDPTTVFPDDPAALLSTANSLYPKDPDARRPILTRAAAADAGKFGPAGRVAVAAAKAELRSADALGAWEYAAKTDPEYTPARDGLARFLETDERYGDAVPHLEWLASKTPNDRGVADRLRGAKHGVALAEALK